jgi:hypothetical protein
MSTLVTLQEMRPWEPPQCEPLKETVWQGWVEKGRAQDRLDIAGRAKAVKWVMAAALLAVAGLWSSVTPYDIVLRFALAAGAMIAMFQAIHARQYAFAAVCGAIALLYNPVAPVFTFSGDLQRAAVVASAAPFFASIAWPGVRTGRNA